MGVVDTAVVVVVDTDAVVLGLAAAIATAEIVAAAAVLGPAVQSTGIRHSTGSGPRNQRSLSARETHYRILQAQVPPTAHREYHPGSCRQKMNGNP